MEKQADRIRVGLKFKSKAFFHKAEISAIREDKNELDVIIIPSDNHAWEEKGWNLKEFRELFGKNHYIEIKPDVNKISVW